MIPLTERINLELRHRNPAEVTELNLDTSKADKIEGLTDEYINLRELSLVNVGLKSLKGFPNLLNLEKLDLSDNRISGDLDCLKFCPKLTQLFLTSNRICNIDELLPLCDLKSLDAIDLCNCDVTKIDNYRGTVFQLLPQLQYLDGYDRNEADDSDGDDYDEEDCYYHNDDVQTTNAKFGYTSGKNGKFSSMMNYHEGSIIADSEYICRYSTGLSDDDTHIYEEQPPLFDTYDTHNVYEDSSEEGEGDEEDSCEAYGGPPCHGSKFVPRNHGNINNSRRCAVKRSYSSEDEYESAHKIFIQDGVGFIPSHD